MLRFSDSLFKSSSQLPHVCGVYFLYDEIEPNLYEIVYIGQSVNIHDRILSHKLDPNKIFVRYTYISVPTIYIDAVERFYIHIYKPRHNINMVYTDVNINVYDLCNYFEDCDINMLRSIVNNRDICFDSKIKVTMFNENSKILTFNMYDGTSSTVHLDNISTHI